MVSNPTAMVLSGIGIVKNPTHSTRYAIVLATTLSVLAYNYIPTGHSDLVRYFAQLEYYRKIGFIQAINISDALFVKNILFWIISKINMPGLLPALSVGLVYGVSFYITSDYALRNNKKKYIWVVILIQFLCLNFVNIANNIRNVIALAAYRDLEKKKVDIITVLLYFLPCFIHKIAFVMILLRLLLLITRKRIIIPALATLLIPELVNIAFKYRSFFSNFGSIGRIISDAILTAYRATISTSDWAVTVMSSKYHLLDRYLTMLICIAFIIILIAMVKQQKTKLIFNFFGFVCLLTIACNVFRTPAYWRFFTVAVCLGGPVMVEMISEKQLRKVKPIYLQAVLMLFSCILFSLHLYGGRQDISILNLFANSVLNPLGIITISFFSELIGIL